jgi:peptidyl-prolyl cis-trans isomerase D
MFSAKNKTIHTGEINKLRQYWGTYAVLGVSLAAMTFFGVCNPSARDSAGPSISGAAAEVAGEKISQAEFRRAYRQQVERLRDQYQDQYNASIMRPAQMVMDQLIKDRILYKSAVEMGLKATQEEVVKYLTEASAFRDDSGKFSQENFENFLTYNGYTEATFSEEMQRSLTVQKLRNLVTSSAHTSAKAAQFDYRIAETKFDLEYLKFSPTELNVQVSADEINTFKADAENAKSIKGWYDSHTSDFNTPEKVHARHILVSFKGARGATGEAANREKADAKKKADGILAKLKAPGAEFVAIAKAETDEASGKTSGGDLGFFARDAMVKEFSDAAFALSKGQLSEPVESPFGYHIIRVEEKQEKKEVNLEAATDEIATKLIKNQRAPKLLEARANEVLAALKEGKPVDALLKDAGNLAWKKTGEFAASASTIPGIGAAGDIQQNLLSLTKEKPLLDKAYEISGAFYIARLAERKDADMTKLDAEKLDQLTGADAYSQGYQFYMSLEKSLEKKYADANSIRRNQEYLALDRTDGNEGG